MSNYIYELQHAMHIAAKAHKKVGHIPAMGKVATALHDKFKDYA